MAAAHPAHRLDPARDLRRVMPPRHSSLRWMKWSPLRMLIFGNVRASPADVARMERSEIRG